MGSLEINRDSDPISEFQYESSFELRGHKFTCGTDGEVVDSISFKIEVPKNTAWQPDRSFNEHMTDQFLEVIRCNFEAYLEAAE